MLAGTLIGAGRGPNRYWQGPKYVLAVAQWYWQGRRSAEVLAQGGPEVLVMAERYRQGPKEVLAQGGQRCW